uniref:RNA helicase n=2 Tax=Ditylum brightwellii TaxID=49249 RepID=A0A7S1VXH7_9STRA|mmetsp:Transcript_10582/g.15708  ORF Transcript_10582/g.15708 Transcript_10582/m.15708 type:complete len:516 (+) Transcript_10582:1685-3232(+)
MYIHYRSTAVYGGAGVAEQIGDLKRGVHIAVATPGRMIDILTMQSGKILSLRRVSYVVMDEADRMFDMGFAPQISAILSAVRPDRQTVLFSATFPKAVETLARKSLKYPIEVMVGGRSVASDSVTQHAEVVEEEDKFLRLLQLLGEHVEGDSKVIVFVDTQARCDTIFEQLLRCGYPSLSLHGGKEQEDRDSTISDFKRNDGPPVLVATSVAGRGLDVSTCRCVINYSSPNHLEDYVHRVGRTGRASDKGVAYTLVNSTDEAKFAPSVVRAMIESGHADNISPALRELSTEFKEKVKKGEARKAGSGFKGKGYSYDSSEMNDAQKLARLEKRQALIEAGMIDADDEDPTLDGLLPSDETGGGSGGGNDDGGKSDAKAHAKLSADVLALPGMKAALMKKAGFSEDTSRSLSTGANHFVEEMEINDYPREARWRVTQKETTSRLQDEFQTAVTLKGEYFGPNREPGEGERKLYLLLESSSEQILQNCILEIKRLLNEETLRVGARGLGGSHRYNVLG